MKYYIGKVPFGKDDNDSLTHYGRKGMKWGKNIFEDEPNQVFKAAGRAANNVAGGAARAVGNAFNMVKNTAKGAGKAVGNFVDNRITGNSNRNLARQYQKEADSAKKDATVNQMRANAIRWLTKDINYGSMPDTMARKVMDTISKAQYDAQNRSWEAGDKARAAQENANAYKKLSDNALANRAGRLVNNVGKAVGGAAKQVYDKTDQLGNRIGINNFGKLMYDPVYAAKQAGKAVGNVANDVGNAVGGAANAAGNWVGDRARDVDRFVNTSITGKNFHDQADRLRSSGNQDAINVANQLDEIGNRSLLGRAGNLANNIGNAVGQAGQWVGDRVNDANRFINTSITGKNFHDQANQIRANSNHPEAANVADQLDEIGNRSLFGRIGNAVGQAGQWAGDRVRDINDLAGQAGNAVGNWVGDRARDVQNFASDPGKAIGDFVDRNITGDSARAEAKEQNRMADHYDTVSKSARRTGIDDIRRAIDNDDDELFNKGLFLRNYGYDQMDKYYDARSKANEAQRQADNSLFGRIGQVGNWIGDRASDIGGVVGSAANAAGNWLGERANDVGNAVGGVANAVGNTVGSAANAAGNWVGDRASDIGNFVDRNITGDSARNYADMYREWAKQDQDKANGIKDRYIKELYQDTASRNEQKAKNYQNEADNALLNRVGNAVGQAGQAVGQTMSNIGDWGGEQLDRGKRILGRLFGRR